MLLAPGQNTMLPPWAAQYPRQPNLSPGLYYGKKFLVDTGAAVSVLPHRSAAPSSGVPLTGADRRPIASWGTTLKDFASDSALSCVSLSWPPYQNPYWKMEIRIKTKNIEVYT